MTFSNQSLTEMQTAQAGGSRSKAMPCLQMAWMALLCIMALTFVGCGTGPGRGRAPAPATVLPPAPPKRVEQPTRPTPTPTPAPVVGLPPKTPVDTPPPVPTDPPIPLGETVVLVESDPVGAMVVVNGLPVGRTPRKVHLPVSSQGFSRETVSIKVRFIADSANGQSQTVEEVLTPLDRMPGTLVFTPTKVQRKK